MRTQASDAFDQSAGLRHAIAEAILDAGCGWNQAMAEVSFVLAVLLAECESKKERLRVGGTLTKALMCVARTGEMPRLERETLQ